MVPSKQTPPPANILSDLSSLLSLQKHFFDDSDLDLWAKSTKMLWDVFWANLHVSWKFYGNCSSGVCVKFLADRMFFYLFTDSLLTLYYSCCFFISLIGQSASNLRCLIFTVDKLGTTKKDLALGPWWS